MDAHIWLALTVSFSGGLGLGCLLAAASRRDDSTAAHCVDPEVVLDSRLDAYAQGYEDGRNREARQHSFVDDLDSIQDACDDDGCVKVTDEHD